MAALIGSLAAAVGASEPALRLLISILSGYPLALVYHKFIKKLSKTENHLYFALSGLLLIIFNYGFDVYHSLVAVLVTYALLHIFHTKPKYLVTINFVFHMAYLLLAYYVTESEEYDIIWTMPHCVLVLRLIGLGFNVSDGTRSIENLSREQKETALSRIPSFLEILAFTYFPACCLVGPQFPFRRYDRYINKDFDQYKGNISKGFRCLAAGVIYLSARQIGSGYLPDEYLLSDDIGNLPLWRKWLILAVWGKLSLYKYISCWLLAEGAATLFGLSFAGVKEDGSEDWSACSNVKLDKFERALKLGHYVISFNVNTNQWVAEYVFKRLKFLNNRTISYLGALFFLALWHGFHTGYYVSFFFEYLTITFERQISSAHDAALNGQYGQFLHSTIAKSAILILRVTYTLVGMGWCLIPFIFLSYEKWLRVFGLFDFVGVWFLAVWFIGHFIYLKLTKRPRSPKANHGSPKED